MVILTTQMDTDHRDNIVNWDYLRLDQGITGVLTVGRKDTARFIACMANQLFAKGATIMGTRRKIAFRRQAKKVEPT